MHVAELLSRALRTEHFDAVDLALPAGQESAPTVRVAFRPRVTVRAPEDQFDLRARHSRESLTRKGGPQAHAAWSPEFPAVVSEKGLRAYRRARWKQNVNQQALPAATLTPFERQQTG